MDAKKRMYYFDGKSILLDTYDDKNFDQVFEDSNQKFVKPSLTQEKVLSDRSFSKIQENNMSNNNISQNNMSQDYLKESKTDNYTPKLLPKEVFLTIKDQYYKTKGYIENRPEVLFEFFLEYKAFEKVKKLKINF